MVYSGTAACDCVACSTRGAGDDILDWIRNDTLSGADKIVELFCRYHEHGYWLMACSSNITLINVYQSRTRVTSFITLLEMSMCLSLKFVDVDSESLSLHFVGRLVLAVNERSGLIMEIKYGV